MNNRVRYTLDEVQRNTYYQMPKFLFMNEFKGISNDARVLYSLLRDRHELSIKNHWVNENNEVYLIYSREDMCDMLGLSKPTIIKAMNNLKEYNLIQEERLGQGKSNRIYLLAIESILTYKKTPLTIENTEKSNSFTSEGKDFLPLKVKNFYPNNTDLKETDINLSQCHRQTDICAERKTDETPTNDDDIPTQPNTATKKNRHQQTATNESNGLKSLSNTTEDEYTTYLKIIQENIEYSHFLHNRPTDISLVDELVNCVLDVVLTKGETVKINGEEKNRQMVISQYLKINYTDIDHILDQFKKQRHKITHLHSYLKTIIYTVKQEQGHYYTNAVRSDGIIN